MQLSFSKGILTTGRSSKKFYGRIYTCALILCGYLAVVFPESSIAAQQGQWGNPSIAKMRVTVTILKTENPGLLELYQFGLCTNELGKSKVIRDRNKLKETIDCLEGSSEIVLLNQIVEDKGIIRLAPI